MWWQIILYGLGVVVGFFALAALGVHIAAWVHARWWPEPDTEADLIRNARRARLRKVFPGLLPEDRK